MPAREGPDPAQVEQWLEQVDEAIGSLQIRLEPLLLEQARLQDRRLLLKELLASLGEGRPSADLGTTPATTHESTRDRVHRQAVEIFSELGRPLHVHELHAEFVKRAYEIPGAGKPSNITVHLSGWADIASPGRGVFGLVEHVGEQPTRPKRKRRKSR